MREKEIHDKAIRLLEGGIVDADGHSVKLGRISKIFDECIVCEMDSLCHEGTEIHALCCRCESMIDDRCYLILNHSG